jgi:hypothetical protein
MYRESDQPKKIVGDHRIRPAIAAQISVVTFVTLDAPLSVDLDTGGLY